MYIIFVTLFDNFAQFRYSATVSFGACAKELTRFDRCTQSAVDCVRHFGHKYLRFARSARLGQQMAHSTCT